jgi:hypothetical protein
MNKATNRFPFIIDLIQNQYIINLIEDDFINLESESDSESESEFVSISESENNNNSKLDIEYDININTLTKPKLTEEEREIKLTLINFIGAGKKIIMRTLLGAILCLSVEIDNIDLDYLSREISPIIENLVNADGKNYKVNL